MRGGSVIVLLGITAFAAYSVGRQDAPMNPPAAAPAAIARSTAQPMAFTTPAVELATPAPQSTPAQQQKPAPDPATAKPESKRKIEAVLTAAAIAAIIIQTSRSQYYGTGHPCACPEDRARNGSACGARSAYSRPNGAAPLCYPSDVTTAMIDAYRQRQASR
jgi:hypothetical protein